MEMAGTKRRRGGEEMSWISRKLFLYNVTVGLYVMDWWERYLFIFAYAAGLLDLGPNSSPKLKKRFKLKNPDSIVLILLWLFCYNTTKSMWQAFDNHLKSSVELGARNLSMVALP